MFNPPAARFPKILTAFTCDSAFQPRPPALNLPRCKSDTSSDSDRQFFKDNPGRKYRFRLATKDEIETWHRTGQSPIKPNCFLFTATQQMMPGMRQRRWCQIPFLGPFDNGETFAKEMFEWLLNANHEFDAGPFVRRTGK